MEGETKPKKGLCCYIPDQTKLDEGCKNEAVFEIWYGSDPTPDDNSLSCAEHLVQMLDDSVRFEIFRMEVVKKPTEAGKRKYGN
jgi:hypothetical protein